jgi:hypothetical protein
MTSDIRIRRLNLKVVQRGAPWLGRDDLKRSGELARKAVLADLDSILERALAGYSGDEQFGTIQVALTLDGALADRVVPFARPQLRAQLATALERATVEALAEQPRPRAPAEPTAVGHEAIAQAATVEAELGAPRRLLALLLAWHGEGCLVQRLRLLPEATMARWLQGTASALDALPAAPDSQDRARHTDIAPSLQHQARNDAVPPAGLPVAGARLMALIELAARCSPFRPPASQVASLRVATPSSSGSNSATIDAPLEGAGTNAAATDNLATPHYAADTPGATDPETADTPPTLAAPIPLSRALPQRCAIHTALPFLTLGPLGRIGWLATAGALLANKDKGIHAHALGYALALKMLPVPERGWRHAPEHLSAAAFAAGLAEPPPGGSLARMQRTLGQDFPGLDAVLADALVRGHDRRAPLILTPAPPGIALVEPEGQFPLALGTGWRDLKPVALAAAVPLLMDATLPSEICAEIDAAGLAFVAQGTPTRGENWHRITGRGSWRGITNVAPEQRAALIETEARHRQVAEGVRLMLKALGPDRPLARGLESGALDRSVTLAAALALGEICWQLAAIAPAAWAQPEPLLALDRFGDLPGTMIVTPDEMEIRLPLGPRSRDLAAAGLLSDVGLVPWLARRLRFGIG